jgi:hypothetical protein
MGCRRLILTEQFLTSFYGMRAHHFRVVRDALPEDARIAQADFEPLPRQLTLIVESEQWQGPPEGQHIPEISPLMVAFGPSGAGREMENRLHVAHAAMKRAIAILARNTPVGGPPGFGVIADAMDRARLELRAGLDWTWGPCAD